MNVLDQRADLNGTEMLFIYRTCDPPEFVKAASSMQLCGDENLAPHLLALQGRLYPMHTAAATWMSSAFFEQKKAQLSPQQQATVSRRLADAALHFGITGYVQQLRSTLDKQADLSLDVLPDNEFAYVWRSEQGDKQRHWPLRNALEVKAAASALAQHRDRFTYADRAKIASRILDKAGDYGAALGDGQYDLLERIAGYGVCAAKQACDLLRQRAGLTRDPEIGEELRKLAAMIEAEPVRVQHPAALHDLAQVVDTVDRALRVKYSAEFPRPEDVLFQLNQKTAAVLLDEHVTLLNGSFYKLADLEELPLDALQEVLGAAFARSVASGGLYGDRSKLAEVLPILPRDDADLFDTLAEAHGIQPATKFAAEHVRLTPEDLMALAAQ